MTKGDQDKMEKMLEQALDKQYVKTGVQFARLNAGIDICNVKLDEVVMPKLKSIDDKVGKINGRVTQLEKDTVLLRKPLRKYLVIGLVVLVVGGMYLYHKVDARTTFENLTKIELDE